MGKTRVIVRGNKELWLEKIAWEISRKAQMEEGRSSE